MEQNTTEGSVRRSGLTAACTHGTFPLLVFAERDEGLFRNSADRLTANGEDRRLPALLLGAHLAIQQPRAR